MMSAPKLPPGTAASLELRGLQKLRFTHRCTADRASAVDELGGPASVNEPRVERSQVVWRHRVQHALHLVGRHEEPFALLAAIPRGDREQVSMASRARPALVTVCHVSVSHTAFTVQ
jgi:hypothetical protein